MALDNATHERLARYVADVPALPNESAKTHRFMALVAELFPGSSAITEFAAGIEKVVRIGKKRGRIDSYYGNAVIEFEKDLAATESTALAQLREYCAGMWNEKKGLIGPLIAVATDGITWKVFRPSASHSVPLEKDAVALTLLRELQLTESTLEDFWIWLTGFLFRPATKKPSPEQFRVEFGATSLAFADGFDALTRAWIKVRSEPEAQLAFDTWHRYLTVTYGSASAGDEELFLKHTYLVSIARLLVWAALSGGRTGAKSHREVAEDVLSGRYFEKKRIQNLVEEDFFQWVRRPEAQTIAAPVWERSISQLQTFDFDHLGNDVLKGVYQELVDPRDRHDLGEYYTPEWLCERLVQRLLPTSGWVSVIDPTCGSGSFLRATITHLLSANSTDTADQQLEKVLDRVVGIDIHPVAVTIARATYVLALGSAVKTSKRPVQVPVYLADSLFLPSEVKQLELGGIPDFEIKFGGKSARLSDRLVKAPELFDPALGACTEIAVSHANAGKESAESLSAYLKQATPRLLEWDDYPSILDGLWKFTLALSELIKERQDSIWAFVVRNGYRPAMLRNRFDYVIGNPPWLSYRYIADTEYQNEVKQRAVVEYGIAPATKKLITHMELATVFLVHALKVFGRDGARIAFVMPRSVLSGDQHARLRLHNFAAPLTLTGYWDLRDVEPLFNVPSCVLFGRRKTPSKRTDYVLPVIEWRGRLPGKDVPWEQAQLFLKARKAKGRIVYLGERNALTTGSGSSKPTKGSRYGPKFRQGATIVPRNCYLVRLPEDVQETDIEDDGVYWVETEPKQAKLAKKPYKGVNVSDPVEGRFLFTTALSTDVVPFALRSHMVAVLPIKPKEGGGILVLNSSELKNAGYRRMAEWMTTTEKIWKKGRKQKAGRQTVYERLDYGHELSRQDLSGRRLVVYNAAGKNLAATVVETEVLARPFVVDHKLYWMECESVDEAHYLAAILNSRAINALIKPFQSTGLLGERDIHKKVLELPIPLFVRSNSLHRALAAAGEEARDAARDYLAENKMTGTVGRVRSEIRRVLAEQISVIDKLVLRLLTDSTARPESTRRRR